MVLNQTFKFKYEIAVSSLTSERRNLNRPFVIRAFKSWNLDDSLNRLRTLTFQVLKNDIDSDDVYFTRKVYISTFKFAGIITAITDLNNDSYEIVVTEEAWDFTRRLYKIEDEFKEYDLAIEKDDDFRASLQEILDSANTGMQFMWTIGDDTLERGVVADFKIMWKSYLWVLTELANKSANDLWFENKQVFFGKKGKSIELARTDKLYNDLRSKLDLNVYANIVTVVGAKDNDDRNMFKTVKKEQTEFEYDFEKVVSDNSLDTQEKIDLAAERVLDEFSTSTPDVSIDIDDEIIYKYDLKSGDVIKISSLTQTQSIKGFFRIIQVNITNTRSSVKLQFSRDGKFLPRVSDSLNIFDAIIERVHNIELSI